MINKWVLRQTDADIELMSKTLGISPVTARVMANRGIRTKKTATRFLRPLEAPFPDVLDNKNGILGMRLFIERLARAKQMNEKVLIYGDYDVDGVTSTVILKKALESVGISSRYYIPNREMEGYGLNIAALSGLAEFEIDLIITVDNGISSIEEVDFANSLGMDVIILDHHEPNFLAETEVLPKALAIINPKQRACPFPEKTLCAAGISYFAAEALFKFFEPEKIWEGRDEALALAACATVCDVVDLIGVNRSIVAAGLSVLRKNPNINIGLGALLEDRQATTETFGFFIGPCINAAGRLKSAELSVALLLSDNEEEASVYAQALLVLNEERKRLTENAASRIMKSAKENPDKVLVIYDEDAHESVAGIVAGRIKDALNKPVIILTNGGGEDFFKGSARSVPDFNMYEALQKNQELLHRFGGHAMAAGLTILRANVAAFRLALQQEEFPEPQNIIKADAELKSKEINTNTARQLDWLQPFGKGFRAPLFLSYGAKILYMRVIKEKNTVILTIKLEDSKEIKALLFGKTEDFLERLSEAGGSPTNFDFLKIDLLYELENNEYNGITSAQLIIRDFKITKN